MKKRVAVLILAVLMAASVLGGCASGKTNPSKYGTTAIAVFEGETIYLDELNYYVRKSQYENEQWGYLEYMGAKKWDDEISFYNVMTIVPKDSLVESAMTGLRQIYVLCKEAEKAGVTLTADDQAKVSAAVEKFLTQTDEELLAYIPLSEERLTEIYTRNALAAKMYQEFSAGVDTTVSDEEACQYDVSYLYLTKELVNGLNLGEGATPESFAGQLVQAVNDGASLEDAIKGMEGLSVKTTTMGDGDFESTYGKVAAELEVGKAGSVSYGSDGAYYVVVRDSDYNEEATEKKKESMGQDKIKEAFAAAYAEWEKAYSFEPNYKKIDSLDVSERIYVAPETQAPATDASTEAPTGESGTEAPGTEASDK